MSVSETQPISVGDLDAILPLPISAGGTGATTATDAIVALGIDEYVQQVVENWQQIEQAKWSGSASTTGSTSMTVRETESSSYISAVGTSYITIANPGTYKMTGQASASGSTYCYVNVSMTVNGQPVAIAGLTGAGASHPFTITFTTSASNAAVYFRIDEYDTNASAVRLANLKITRIS